MATVLIWTSGVKMIMLIMMIIMIMIWTSGVMGGHSVRTGQMNRSVSHFDDI